MAPIPKLAKGRLTNEKVSKFCEMVSADGVLQEVFVRRATEAERIVSVHAGEASQSCHSDSR